MMDLREQTISGILWSAIAQVCRLTLRFIIAVILARLLTPDEFGLIGMIMVFTGFASLFSEMGFGAAIIQKQDVEERHLYSVFWLNLAVGLALTVIVASCSPLIASFYDQPILIPLTVAISFTFLVGSLNVVQNSLLRKRMDFRRLAAIEIGAVTFAGILSIIMALKGFGVWSLVANSLLITAASVAIMWYLSQWRPRLILDPQAIKELVGFSAHLLGFRISNYWMSNIDNLLIGKYVSSAALGVYGRAFDLMLLPVTQLSWVLSRVMFPALSAIQSDKEKVKQVFLRANRAIALLSFPMMMGLLVVAESFILAIYGQKWEAVILILQIFCLDGLKRSVGTTVGWIYLSQGRTELQFRWGVFAGIVRVVTIIIGLRWGAVGVAFAIVLTGYIILWYPAWTIPGRLINLTFSEMLKNLAAPFYCSLAMAAAVVGVGFFLPSDWPHWARLAAQVPLGIAVYAALIHLFKIRAYREVRELAAEQWGLRFGKSREM